MKYVSYTIFLVCCFLSSLSYTQIVSYQFDGNIEDQIRTNHATYIISEDETDEALVSYESSIEGQAVLLDSLSGFKLPLDVTVTMFSSDVITFKMTFKVTNWGSGSGRKDLVNHRRKGTNTPPRYQIEARKVDDDTGLLYFYMSDGTTNISSEVGTFPFNEWVTLSLTIDFTEKNWTAVSDFSFMIKDFSDTDFDYDTFKTYGRGLENEQIYIGYAQDLAKIQPNTVNTASIAIDEFTIYNATPETDVNIYTTALQKLIDHLEGTIVLTGDEITGYVAEILLNYKNQYIDNKAIVDHFIAVYEQAKPPLFESSDRIAFFEYYEPIDQVSLVLKLDILDNYFTSDHITNIEGMRFEEAEIFPGPVNENAERISEAVVSINGTFLSDPGYELSAQDKGVMRPTGYYAVPGELITISVDPSLINYGIEIIVGAHVNDLSRWLTSKLNRFPKISKKFSLNSTEIQVANPFGGAIYFNIPLDVDAGIFEATIDGAIKAPFFSSCPHNATTEAEWQAEIEKGDVLWMDMESEYMQFTVPSFTAYYRTGTEDNLVSPADILEIWDTMWKTFQEYAGRPEHKIRAEYYQIDRRGPTGALSAGYPMAGASGNAPFSAFPTLADYNPSFHPGHILHDEQLRQDGSNLSILLHELTHNMGMPTLNGETEVIVSVTYSLLLSEVMGWPIDESFKYSERFYLNRDQAAVDWMIAKNFREGYEIGYDSIGEVGERPYQHRAFAKYIDMGDLLGWEAIGNGHKVFYDKWTSENSADDNLITGEEFIKAFTESNNLNIAPLIHFWGYHPSEELKIELDTLPRSVEVYERLRYYRDLVPRTLEDFQPYYDAVANDDPHDGQLGTGHFAKYELALTEFTNEDYASQMIAQIDYLLEYYYNSDFDDDGLLFYEDPDDTEPDMTLSSPEYTKDDIVLYPNPVSDVITISGPNKITYLELFDILGKRVIAVEDMKELNVKHLQNGVYTIKISIDEQILIKKVVINK